MAECRAARQAQTARSASPTVPACALTRPEPAAGWRVPTDVSCMVRVLSLKVVERDDEGDAGDRGSDRTPGGTCARDSTQAGTARAEQRRGQLRRPQRERPARTPRTPHAPHTPRTRPTRSRTRRQEAGLSVIAPSVQMRKLSRKGITPSTEAHAGRK